MRHGSVVLLHSPLVGAETWGRFPAELGARGLDVTVLAVTADEEPPYASNYVAHAAQQLAAAAIEPPLVLVGHSGAGPLLPQVGMSQRAAGRRVGGYVFLDAGLPRPNATRLDLLDAEDPELAASFRAELASGGRFPAWHDSDLRAELRDAADRALVLGAMRPRALDFFTEPVPHPDDWPDAPCGYLRTSATYEHWSRVAELRGWTVAVHATDGPAGHFAALGEPRTLARSLVELLERM